ncbi:MAG: sugar transferase [Cyanobacteriota bacterium]|nr:sugar transferase [Cyanobacteriota bacterium]
MVLLKRGADLVVAALALLLLAPLLLLVALAVRLDSPGPVLFRQQRVGLGGRTFEMLKFRSMVEDAPRLGGYSTASGDPRITRSGRWLRQLSLDELPQLINVLRGDMSLVGPRPDVPAQRSSYSAHEWQQRHRVRPGITGLAQATVRSDARPGQRKALDLQYVREQSLGLDLWILLLTLRQLLCKGSY